MPSRRDLYSYLVFAVLLLLAVCGVTLLAQGVTPAPSPTAPVPVTPPPLPPYVAPDYHEVLAGKTPLRVLLVAHKTMVAWKGDTTVHTSNIATNQEVNVAKSGEMVGIVRTPESTCYLRQNGKNFCTAPGTIRLSSSKSIAIWTPTPDTWITVRGPLIITSAVDNQFSISQEIVLEEYLRNVVCTEMPSTFHTEALRVQAIIARTYTLAKLGRHAEDGADVCATEHCQMYGADARRTREADAAVNDTRGLVLLYKDQLADAYYHAVCGGVTDDAGYLWGPENAQPYLVGGTKDTACTKDVPTIDDLLKTDDSYCKRAGSFKWTKEFSAAEVDALVAKNLTKVTGDPAAKITRVTNMSVEERTPHGRALSLRVEGDGASYLVIGDQIRWLLGSGAPGPDGLWSTLFDLTITRDPAGTIKSYAFRGAGRGHGIGLCQWGADGRARTGQNYREILAAYYPGTQLSNEKATGGK